MKRYTRTIVFFLVEALNNMKMNKGVSILTVGSMAISMSFLGLFFIFLINLDSFFENIQSRPELYIYLKDSVSSERIKDFGEYLKKEKQVKKITFVSKENALKEFQDQFKWAADTLTRIENNPLPASYVISLNKEYTGIHEIESFANTVMKSPIVEEVDYGRDWILKLEMFISIIRVIIVVAGWILAVGLLFIISSTIRLSIYSRIDGIEVMKLVGATQNFIKGPFIIEGVIQAILGVIISILLLGGVFLLVESKIIAVLKLETLFFLPIHIISTLFLIAITLGMLGAHIAIRDILKIRV